MTEQSSTKRSLGDKKMTVRALVGVASLIAIVSSGVVFSLTSAFRVGEDRQNVEAKLINLAAADHDLESAVKKLEKEVKVLDQSIRDDRAALTDRLGILSERVASTQAYLRVLLYQQGIDPDKVQHSGKIE